MKTKEKMKSSEIKKLCGDVAKHTLWIAIILFLVGCSTEKLTVVPKQLVVNEGLVNPLGFHSDTPVFSWKLSKASLAQSAYEIVVASGQDLLLANPDLWSSGKRESSQSLYVKYDGAPLNSRDEVFWQVRYWDEKGEASSWSEVATFELGLLTNQDWEGNWISIPDSELQEKDTIKGNRGSLILRPQYFRKEINIDSEIKQARLYITAKGVFEAYINGNKVSNDVMSPGWTPLNKSISTLTYDVTDLVRKGENAIGAVVAEGWHSGRINLRKTRKRLEHTPQLLYQLEIETKDGKVQILSDDSWKVTNQGPIRAAKIYDGEFYDANFELGNWSTLGYDDSQWLSAVAHDLSDSVLLMPKRFETTKDQLELQVVNFTNSDSGRPIFDFGQNNVGVPRVQVPMTKGDTLVIRFAEMLDADGSLFTRNYRSAISTDYYVAAADGVIDYRPTFTFHGYRYVELSGFASSSVPQNDWVTAIVQYSDFEENGSFTSSHDKLNQLQSNITWGLRSNFLDVPTDCPQRDERLGWTGDAQVIAPTSVFYADMGAFWSGYLQSMRQEQYRTGGIPNVIPNVLKAGSSSGWGDACVIIPYELYFRTGDKRVLAENYDMMKGWLRFYASKANDHIVSMRSFADWLQPYPKSKEVQGRRGDTPPDFVSTAYYARSVELTMKSAQVLGKTQEANELALLLDSIKIAFDGKFFDEEAKVTHHLETQTQYLLALKFDLLPEGKVQKAREHLVRVISEADNHLGTGFLGTPLLPFVLDEAGETDLMYEILFKETYPSWFYSINQGATTMWERWDSYTHKDGFNPGGMNSFNHYAYGAIGQWMYERIAGIKPVSPGYKEIEIAPIPGGPLTSTEASYDSPYGKVRSSWKIIEGKFHLEVVIPPNTSAKIIVPGLADLKLNGVPFSDQTDVKLIEADENGFKLEAKPGTYLFESQLDNQDTK
ncbi:MAG: family 78 glycoside hydrolase catalytic domain [Cyclobacteriaceae bacterium]